MSNDTPTPPTPKNRLRKSVKVHPHKSGRWTVCIGKALNDDKTKLRPKDFYFARMTESDANREANKLNGRWRFIVSNWSRLYQSTLRLIGDPFADIPHWRDSLLQNETVTDADVEEYRRKYVEGPPTIDDLQDAYADATLPRVFLEYQFALKTAVANGDKGQSTLWTDEKNIRNGLKFFDPQTPLNELTGTAIGAAKTNMLSKLSRRTASNYLEAVKRMLVWFYDSDMGRGHIRPSNFDKSFAVRKATRTDVNIPTIADVKRILDAADDWQRLFVMLALNCGMYQADIGRLTLSELNLVDGYAFWDREKQPMNPFKVRHDLWEETLVLVRKFAIAGEPSALAFKTKQGMPLYRMRASGKSYSVIDKAWQKLNETLGEHEGDTYQFKNLRKATNQVLTERLANDTNNDVAIAEISKTFLAQKTTELERVYATRGVNGFGKLNKYLAEAGEVYRQAGAFESIKVK